MRRALPLFALVAAWTTFAPAPAHAAGAHGWCGTSASGARAALWAHREQAARRGFAQVAATGVAAQDVGDVAVLQDEGDLALFRNPLDLSGAGLQFAPGASYSVSRVDRPVAAAGANPLTLGDDDSRPLALSFSFPFYGRSYSSLFVNSDGNLTFGAADSASTARNVGRLVSGPPRVAPLLADLDVTQGGSITYTGGADSLTVVWTDVPQYGKSDRNTFEVTLRSDGRIEFAYGRELGLIEEAAAGIAPGNQEGGLTGVDLSAAAANSGPGALAEGFRSEDTLDIVAVARKFYRTHGDDYQQLVVYTSRHLLSGTTFAYEVTVQNHDAGIGTADFSDATEYGSAGRLESFVDMDFIEKYADDFERAVVNEDNTLSVLAHEVGHRWLAHARFRDGASDSDELLGRQQAHWSFFMHSSGSHLEGNDIEDLGGSRFRTGKPSVRYGPLDQYLMGLRSPEEVPPFFLVRNPIASNNDPARAPRSNETFEGTRKDLTVQDVIAALGPRNPAPAPWAQPFRQAFVYVAVGGPADGAALARIERIRGAFQGFFVRSSDGRGAVESILR